MTRKNIQIANAALFGAMTIMSVAFTSCSDEKDDFNSTSVTGKAASIGFLADTYTYTGDAGNLTLKLNGNDVFVSRNGSGNGTPNGKLVFTTHSGGTLEMTDSTFSTKKIPFVKGTDIFRLDFNGTGEFADNTIFLKRSMMTRAGSSEGDVIPGVLSEKDGQSLLLKTTRTLIDKFVKGTLGEFGADLTKPLIDLIYPSEGATESNEAKELRKLESKIDDMQGHILLLEQMNRQNTLGTTYKRQWDNMKNLSECVTNTKEALSKETKGEEDWKKTLHDYAYSSIDGNSLYIALKNWLEEYQPIVGQKPLLQQIDEYLVTSYPFLSQSTGERLFYRAVCLQTLTEATQLMVGYYREIGQDQTADRYETALKNLYSYFTEKSAFDPHEDEIVCTISGAYLVMDKKVGVKAFGATEFASGSSSMSDIGWDGQDLKSTEWAYSYVFSLKGSKTHKTELNTMCLTPDEAKAIAGYNKNKTLYQTLIQDAGMIGFDYKYNVVMLLSTWAYPDWEIWNADKCHIMTRVWDFSKNQYNSNYEVDEILSHKGIYNWYGHKTDSKAYYTNVTKRFSGITAYADFIDYVVTPPLTQEQVKEKMSADNNPLINILKKKKN